ncbi:putative transcription factor interactor and regulator CCHC(Zn) family [Helianthus annuus]|nr:putative transcription factor interactor and regulator CCHC(Zn) family [Helianthus annuus]KAJ0664223.1 putative transcription factor interactor and regulator CCHC(Zn) family [Helianthus annuus]
MDEDFYNAFATPSTSINAIQTTMLENETGTMQKPPKLMNIEEYKGWEGRFENWVQANYLDAWECVETKYVRPLNDDEEPVPIKDLKDDERKKYKNEKMMLSLLQQAVKEDIMFRGSEEMVKSKKSLLKKEFDLFRGLKNESTREIIERYCNLLANMKRLSIEKSNEELIDKLADALPYESWGTYLMMLRNKKGFSNLTLSKFIEKIEAQEMEQRKVIRMKDFDGEQDIGLYYKAGVNEKSSNSSPKIVTSMSAKSFSESPSSGSSSKTSFTSFPSIDPNISATKNGRKLQCNIVLNLENDQDYSEDIAKNQMYLLGMVLESYTCFVAGRIGNPMLTKEDYDQIDAEEMELMDIKWCLASVLRRAEKFKQITGRDDLRDANVSTLGFDKSKVTCFRCREKGHFKRECTNREASGAQNPFNNNNDYYRKAIYHQVDQSSQQQKHQAQTAHGRDVIEDTGKRACVVNPNQKQSFTWDNYIPENGKACLIDQEDEKLAEGFSWAKFTWDDYVPDQTTAYTAFTAKIVDDSDDDTEYWARKYREDMKLLAESDSEDEKVKKEKKKKKIKTPVSSDDEEVPVARRQKMTEVPKFKVKEQVDAKEVPVKCENCEIVKKQNNTLINNLNRLKESYDVLNKAMNQYNQTSEEQAVAMKTLQGAFMTKQKVVNNYIEKCAALEQKLELQRIETERVNRLLKSYSCTSYVIDRIYPTVESMKVWEEDEVTEEKAAEVSIEEKIADKRKSDKKKDTEKASSGKKKGVSYNRCPPPLENGYLPRHPNDERVKKATNLQWESESSVNLPESIDVVFTSSDTDQQSQLMKKVVDHVLDSDDSEESKSESASESKSESKAPSQTEKQGKLVYDRKFLLSKSNLDDGLFKVAYTLNNSDKLYSDEEFPLRGVKTELINKVFKLTEINISEIKGLCFNDKSKKYTSRVQQRLNKKKNYSSGTSTDEEEKNSFWREKNSEFWKKKQAALKKDSRTCFKCNNVGHIAKDCSQAIQSKQGVFRKISEKVFAFESPLDRTKLFKDSIFEIGESSNKFYKKRAKSNNQKWVVKKVSESSSDDSDRSKSEELSSGDETDSTKSVEPQVVSKCEADLKVENSVPSVSDDEFPSLRAENYKKKIGKVEISNQFYHDEQEFDAEKVFNPMVKHIFGKMIDRKVKGVKEFYEKKTKKEKS